MSSRLAIGGVLTLKGLGRFKLWEVFSHMIPRLLLSPQTPGGAGFPFYIIDHRSISLYDCIVGLLIIYEVCITCDEFGCCSNHVYMVKFVNKLQTSENGHSRSQFYNIDRR